MSDEEPMNADEPVEADAVEEDNANGDEPAAENNENANGDDEAGGDKAETDNNEDAESGRSNPFVYQKPIDTRTPVQRVLAAIPRNKDDQRDIAWEDVLLFYQIFGKTIEGEELEHFQKKYNPDKKETILQDKALPALAEFIGKDEFILMLQSESKILDQNHGGYVHHAEDFRMMLKELGEDIGDDLVNDFIREALGKGDDEFDINVYLQFMCQETHWTEEIKKSKVGR